MSVKEIDNAKTQRKLKQQEAVYTQYTLKTTSNAYLKVFKKVKT